jgi:hypothetical protein
MSRDVTPIQARAYDELDDATAQDVVDALRLLLMSQQDKFEAMKLVTAMLEFAPETDSNRGVDLILRLLAEGSLKAALVDA